MAEPNDDPINDKPMPLLDHLVELRSRLLWAMVSFVLAFFAGYYFSEQIYRILAAPVAHALEARGQAPKMIFTGLTEGFFTYVKVAMFAAAFIAFPVIATQLWLFVAPGLYRSEKRAMLPFLAATPVLFALGASLAYFFVFPVAMAFFLNFQSPGNDGGVAISAELRVGEYLDFVMRLVLAFGVAFQLPVALSLMAKVGLVTSTGLKKFRRYAIVGVFVFAAIIAPPDIITQIGLAIPLMLLYELSILAARIVEPKVDPS